MQIRLIRKLADYLDGIDVSDYREGDVVVLPRREAELLIAEKWAAPIQQSSTTENRGISVPPNRAAAASHPTSDQIRRFREEIEKQHSEPERRRDKGSVRHGEPASRGRTNRRRR